MAIHATANLLVDVFAYYTSLIYFNTFLSLSSLTDKIPCNETFFPFFLFKVVTMAALETDCFSIERVQSLNRMITHKTFEARRRKSDI